VKVGLMLLLVLLNTLQLPPKVIAQSPSEAVKVLADDVIQSLKANDVKKANMHLSILNQGAFG
jgi:hypothetical protein